MLYILGIIVLLITVAILFTKFAPVFGGVVEGKRLDIIKKLEYFKNGKFENISGIKASIQKQEGAKDSGGIKDFLFPKKGKIPTQALPSKKFDAKKFNEGDFVWFGHSTILFRTDGKNILTDPVFNRASPIPIFGKEFEVEYKTQIKELPKIDAIIISHDHYDHLDYKAIQQLAQKTKKIFVPIGVGTHLEAWGIEKEKIIELVWYETHQYENIDFTLTPTQHFSGRGLQDRNKTLWGAWVVTSKNKNVYFSGDTGYFDEFKKVGERYGPFDIAFIENGAYNSSWPDVHMLPESSVQAGIDLDADILFPIHWSKFDLAFHRWDEPANRFTTEAEKKGKKYAIPLIGEVFSLDNIPTEKWWNTLIIK